jgi:hypothetical protein
LDNAKLKAAKAEFEQLRQHNTGLGLRLSVVEKARMLPGGHAAIFATSIW